MFIHFEQIYHVWEGHLRKIPVERQKISRPDGRMKFNLKTGIFRKYPSQLTQIILRPLSVLSLDEGLNWNVGKLNNELNIVNQLVDLHFLLFVNITGNWKNRLAHIRQIIIADWLSLSESSWHIFITRRVQALEKR
jgi:hypothetical protein